MTELCGAAPGRVVTESAERSWTAREDPTPPPAAPPPARGTAAWRRDVFAVLFLVLCLLLFFQFLNSADRIGIFKASHWVFDYSLGFVRRGLVGAVTEAIFGSVANSYAFIEWAAIALCAACFLGYAAAAAWIASARPSAVAIGAALAGALLAPALPAFAYDLGRFEQVNFLLLLGALLVVAKGPPAAVAAAVALAGSAALFVHEGFLVLQFPMLLGLALLRLVGRDGMAPGAALLRVLLPACAVVLAAFLLVWGMGGTSTDPTTWRAHWVAQAPFITLEPDNDAVHVHGRSVVENLRWTLANLTLQRLALAGVVLLCGVYAGGVLWFGLCRQALGAGRRPVLPAIVFLSFLSPAIMVPIGLDTMRWAGIVVLNTVLGVLFLVHLFPDRRFDLRFLRVGGRGRSGPDRRAMLRTALLALAVSVLLFPQATGVVGMRRLTEPVACMVGTPRIPSSMPRHPELCLRP